MDLGMALMGTAVTAFGGLLAYFAKRDYELHGKRIEAMSERLEGAAKRIADLETHRAVEDERRASAAGRLGDVRLDVERLEGKVDDLAAGYSQQQQVLAAINSKLDIVLKATSPPRGMHAVPQPAIPQPAPAPGYRPRTPSRPDRG